MHLILTGVTGLAGSGVLDAMLKMPEITKISILSRRPVKMLEDVKDPRVHVIIHKDFEKYDPKVLSELRGATGCVWALGISQTQVGKDEYIKITKTYALEAAKAFQTLPPSPRDPFNFVYISGSGATTEPGWFSMISARTKGETEAALAEMRRANPQLHASSVRPAFIDEWAHEAIKPYVPAKPLAYKFFLPFVGVGIRRGMVSLWSPTEPLGRFLVEMAMGRHQGSLTAGNDIQKIGEFPILENTAFRRLAGLDR
ncbi:putative nucleoside-diphosphate-sugar epimerase [Pseudomassariella vexata]|uniref:Putative nucleoside-diphosphate-sugar epimerase n=1 Tax=Pseudomassariella vexata TaxID=1141098 RepID=A0A1Y2EFU0_9PEZI|nr:putative nucleoside-diphosphate-sugar epimerase [Pseudomassariella vexata]ORY70448.1 putative nucleoside-diphosphate-sugar epimerase [Pseudomassariella vexata]